MDFLRQLQLERSELNALIVHVEQERTKLHHHKHTEWDLKGCPCCAFEEFGLSASKALGTDQPTAS